MRPIDQYATLSDFTTGLDQPGEPVVPLKIMGKKRSDAFFSISMLGEVYRQTEDPDSTGQYQTVKAPFGEILMRGARLHADRTYSTIMAHPSGANHFQGDAVELDLSNGGTAFPRHRFSMFLSHTCDIQKLTHMTLAPAYLESDLTDAAITELRGGLAPKNSAQIRGMWLSNETPLFLGLPATDALGTAGPERLVVCLHLGTPVPKDIAIANAARLRLKYRASSYLQGRLEAIYANHAAIDSLITVSYPMAIIRRSNNTT